MILRAACYRTADPTSDAALVTRGVPARAPPGIPSPAAERGRPQSPYALRPRLEPIVLSRRVVAMSALFLLAPLALYAANPRWAAAVGLDVWNMPTLRAEVENQSERGRSLVAKDDDIRRRIEVKELLIADLIAGRTTLADVAAQFLALNRSEPGYMDTLRAIYPGESDEETAARTVMGFVSPRLAGEPPARQAEVAGRLEAEYARLVELRGPAAE